MSLGFCRRFVLGLVTIAIGIAIADGAMAMEEVFVRKGNKPVEGAVFDRWPGVLAVINDPNRVYHYHLTRGLSESYFRGDTNDVNDALARFSKIESPQLDVVLRPASGFVKVGFGEPVPCSWGLWIPGAQQMRFREHKNGPLICPSNPVMTIYVGGDVRLSELKIPKKVRVQQLADLRRGYATALLEPGTDQIRGIAAERLSRLAPYDDQAMKLLSELLGNATLAVRNNAAYHIGDFGVYARVAVPRLKKMAESSDGFSAKRARDAIAKIESSKRDPSAELEHRVLLARIAKYLEKRSR